MAALLKICFGRASYGPANEVIAEIGYRQWRIASWRLLKMLPGPSVHLTKWGGQAKEAVGRFLDEMGWKPEIELGRNLRKCSDEAADRPVADFVDLVPPEGDISCSVVHQVKGETYDAVMLYCHPADKKHRSALQQWLDPQHGEGEERRIAYVAATRPRRLLVLALPTGTSPTLLSTLQGAFVLRDD